MLYAVNVAVEPTVVVKTDGSTGAVGAVTVDVTASVNGALVMEPPAFETTTSNCAPLSAAVVAAVVYVDVVAPAIATPPRRHWNAIGALPVTTTDKVAVLPATTLTVCATLSAMVGATGLTVSVAAALCTVPPPVVTPPLNPAPPADRGAPARG